MDAKPFLTLIAEALDDVGLEAVLVGNAAAALRGAPVSTLDFDFMFRKTPANLRKLKHLARRLGAVILRPYYPVTDLYRVLVEDTGLQLDFMSVLHGISSFEALRSRAERATFGRAQLWVASLDDVIASKKALADQGTSRCWIFWRGPPVSGKAARGKRLERLRAETEKAELEQIRHLLDMPMEKRTHFLRRRTGFVGSAL